MTSLRLVILSIFLLGFTAAYDFQFNFQFNGPVEECTNEELSRLFRKLEDTLEVKANEYLDRKGFEGVIEDVQIDAYNRRELSEEEELEMEERELAGFVYSGRAKCFLCPPDDGDGRRHLRLLAAGDKISKSAVNAWVNNRLTPYIQRLITTHGSPSCSAHASEFSAAFTWL